jgi:hypothetical protein
MKNNMKIKFITKTWSRDSYGLFDYEGDDNRCCKFTVKESGSIYREGNNIKFTNDANHN